MNMRFLHFFAALAAAGFYGHSALGQSPDGAATPAEERASPVTDEAQEEMEALERSIAKAKVEVERLTVETEQLGKDKKSAAKKAKVAAMKAERAREKYDERQQQLLAVRARLREREAELTRLRQVMTKLRAANPDEARVMSATLRQEVRERMLTLTAIETELHMDILGKRTHFERWSVADPQQFPLTPDLVKMRDGNRLVKAASRAFDSAEAALADYVANVGKDAATIKRLERRRNVLKHRLETANSLATTEIIMNLRIQSWLTLIEAEDQLHAVKERLSEARDELRQADLQYNRQLQEIEDSKK